MFIRAAASTRWTPAWCCAAEAQAVGQLARYVQDSPVARTTPGCRRLLGGLAVVASFPAAQTMLQEVAWRVNDVPGWMAGSTCC